MNDTPYKTPYDEGYRDGEEIAQKQLAEARELGLYWQAEAEKLLANVETLETENTKMQLNAYEQLGLLWRNGAWCRVRPGD